MTAPRTSGDPSASDNRPRIRVDRQDAETQIDSQREKGLGLHSMLHTLAGADGEQASWDNIKRMEREYKLWDEYNREMLMSLFDSDEVARDYSTWGIGIVRSWDTRLDQQFKTIRDALYDKVAALDSVKQKMTLYDELALATGSYESNVSGDDVFVVHGHDEAAKQSVARFIETLGLDAIILHEQPNEGRTIIEKFEDYSSVGYTVVLLTPDDVGALASEPEAMRPRARQNVIFELGFFVGKLGRKNVCVLYKPGVERPSDYQGVVFEPLDDGEGWKLKLYKEMKAAGLDVDASKL